MRTHYRTMGGEIRRRSRGNMLPATLGALSFLLAPVTALAWPAPLLEAGETQRKPDPFPAPPKLAAAVQFWTEIFSKHNRDRILLHDREQLEIVWQVIELPKDEEGKVDESATIRLVKEATAKLRERLRRLERDPTPKDEEDRIALTLAGGHDPAKLPGAWTRVRAQRGVADNFKEGMVRAKLWLATMREILVEEKVPTELVALSFVESMFNPDARSAAGAAGAWQLMPATARGLGLKVKRGADERLDVKKATRAAARMLRKNHEMLGTWPLAITAYNHGPNGMRRAVKSIGSTDLVYLIEHYEKPTWGFASKNFYAEFLAAMKVFAKHEAEFPMLVKTETAPSLESRPTGH